MDKLIKTLVEETTLWTPKIIAVLTIVTVFYVLARLLKKLILKTSVRLDFDPHLTSLLARTASITLLILGLVTALGTLGINVSALVAGLGLTGFAIGFALKDTISNLLSGVLILLYRPFETGNRIRISGYEGVVISIDLRYTKLESDKEKVLIPNSKLFKDPITILQSMN